MELFISIAALVASFAAIFVSVFIEHMETVRQRKQSTLDAFNALQEQVLDNINLYTKQDIIDICNAWQGIVKKTRKDDSLTEEENKMREQYRLLSGYLARIEHFALGVNEKIYDAKVADRAGTSFLIILYRDKLSPLIKVKEWNPKKEYYGEFRKLVERLEKIEAKQGK